MATVPLYESLKSGTKTKLVDKASVFAFHWPISSLFFVSTIFLHVAAGLVALRWAPESPVSAADVRIPADATCLRTTRHSDYTTLDIVVGTPLTQLSVLLRLDGIKSANDTSESTLRFFSADVVESSTVTCGLGGVCTDVLLSADGTRKTLELQYAQFSYRHASIERSLYTVASSIGGVVGEFFLREGFDYWLTSTHLCYSSRGTDVSQMVPVNVQDGRLVAARQDLSLDDVLGHVPAARSPETDCNATKVHLFPHEASVESSWLSISDSTLYNTAPQSVESRREIAEIGVSCAANSSSLARDLTLYLLDCSPFITTCRDERSVPYRRVATTSMFLSLTTTGNYGIRATVDNTLFNLPRLANSSNAFYASLLKMAAITLAAAVVYVRSKKKTASSSWLFKNCLSIAKRRGALSPVTDENSDVKIVENVVEDQIVGVAAIFGRLVVVLLQNDSLALDGQARVCAFEYVAILLSTLHFALRYLVLHADDQEAAISKLGGSTAIIDSTAAVMLAFSQTPTLGVSTNSFDPTARMLVALLISTIVVSRCAFSSACCGTLYPTFKDDCRFDYCYLLLYSGATWAIQSAILGCNVCDLFVVPSAYAMIRTTVADEDTVFIARVALFFALTTAGLPRLMSTTRHILSEKMHVD